tara:strand:+ start:625 stop:831 length:207 start_codon:yes stop_codon:yes gene_type:complete
MKAITDSIHATLYKMKWFKVWSDRRGVRLAKWIEENFPEYYCDFCEDTGTVIAERGDEMDNAECPKCS